MVAFDDLVFYITDQGHNDRLLGRCSFFTITGKNSFKTPIVNCYCPCKGRFPGSVYSQHLLYMSENESEILECMTCPKQLFGHDLKNFLETRTEQRDRLIVCGDFNSNYSDLSNWMLEMVLTLGRV